MQYGAIYPSLKGKTVLVTGGGSGIGEAIVDGESGLLVAPRDPAAISRALLALLGDESLRTRLGDTARAVVARDFTRAGMIARLADVYEEVLSGVSRE